MLWGRMTQLCAAAPLRVGEGLHSYKHWACTSSLSVASCVITSAPAHKTMDRNQRTRIRQTLSQAFESQVSTSGASLLHALKEQTQSNNFKCGGQPL